MQSQHKLEIAKTEKQDANKLTAQEKAKVANLEEDMREMRDQRDLMEQEMGSITYKLSTLEPKLKNLEKDRAHYKAECEDAQSKHRRTKAELTQVENQLKERERISATHVADLKEKTNTINNLKRQKLVLEEEVNRYRKESEAAKNSSEINRAKILELQKRLANANQDISKLNITLQQDRVEAPQVQQVRTVTIRCN